MPQMMPLNWFLLYSFFTLMLIIINMMNFYISFNKSSTKLKHKILMMKKIIWKW
uniref:ATP synthase F0 subunit 8 n=1 Tax=Arria pallida TaxID=2754859 RepID=A0A7G6KSN4_9NEOP|nr:ATP synthase F0 subunit 8 [Arria pallida]QNC71416.1 ATP synthase F0 subunit 8 [Arria pallida]